MRNAIIEKDANRADMSTTVKAVSWILRLTSAVILLQTLYFKFTGAPESVYIFTKVHAEPWGRIGSGVMELVASLLLLTPRYAWLGSLLAACAAAGAILSHLTLLGIEVQNDKGLLFTLAIVVFLASLVTLFLHRRQIPLAGDKLQKL
jgi:uncharacterized membrane protein YphA (DoxX/SURF4 family)